MLNFITISKIPILVLIFEVSHLLACPPPEQLHPCTCEEIYQAERVRCFNFQDVKVLQKATHLMKNTSMTYYFNIQNGNFAYFTKNTFKYTKVIEVYIKSCNFTALTNTNTAFEGLEDSLQFLTIRGSRMLHPWNWSFLRNLKKLSSIKIEVNLPEIRKDIDHIKNVESVNLSNNNIMIIYKTAFSEFKNLTSLYLRRNLIHIVKRSMLPYPASLLLELDFSYNRIYTLPADMFDEMPRLKVLSLKGNVISTLNEKTFIGIWGQLSTFLAGENPLNCDCKLSWILEQKLPYHAEIICFEPALLSGTSISELNVDLLGCPRT